jgi:Flp pilus assembly protein TadB
VQRELATVRGEIEQIEGRKRFLENQSSLSTVKIKLQSPTAFAGSSSGFFYQLGQAISTGLNGALSFILILVTALIALLPFFLFIVLPIYLVIRYFVRKNRRQKSASEIARDEVRSE